MNCVFKLIYCAVLFPVFAQNVLSENATTSNVANNTETRASDNRRSNGLLIMDDSGKSSDRQSISSQKLETETYTKHVSASGSAGSDSLRGWISGSQNEGNMILPPQIQGTFQTQDGCGKKNNVLINDNSRTSLMQKKSILGTSQIFNGGSSIDSLASNANQWQSGQQGARLGSLVVGQLGGQSSIVQGSSSRVTSNMNDLSGTMIAGNLGVNSIYQGTNRIQNQQNLFYPDNESYKISIISSGDGIYANELIEQQAQNLNMMIPKESNSPNIVAVPVVRSQLGRYIVQGYRPNIQYYLRQIEANNLIKNPSAMLKVPSFIEGIKPDEMNFYLSEDQLNSYKQYLIQSGLIKLKPYQLIFSDQFRPKLSSLQWMVVPLESNSEYCKQRCGSVFPRNTLYSTITENASKLPLKLLVPVLKIRGGLTKTINGVQNIAGGVGDISGGMFRMMKDTPSHIAGLVKEKSEESKSKNQN